MALSKKSLQRKREKKKNKRKIKVSTSFLSTTIAYQNWSIYECRIPIELWENGIGQVIISRKNNQGDIVLEYLKDSCGEMELVEPSYANTLIIKSAEYANQFGFKPHNDFSKARNLLKGIPIDENLTFTFGRDGRPCYIQGPNESPADVKRILKTLDSNQGAENYHFLIEAPHSSQLIENDM